MEQTCYNPYHFVPVSKRSEAQRQYDLTDRELLRDDRAGATTHERYAPATHSGRLVCKFTTKTPLVLGAEQKRRPGEMGEVAPYSVIAPGDKEARPAIPASSLRGLFSSLAETASNSAMRVLTEHLYSYRKPFDPKFTLSAIGVIVKSDNGELRLKPVTLPTLECATDRNGRPLNYYVVPPKFRRIFPQPAFKVYLGDYNWVRRDNNYRTSPDEQTTTVWGVVQLKYDAEGNLGYHPSLHCKPKRENPKFAVAQDADTAAAKRPGLLRILGCWGDRTAHIPEGKKHELWLPVPGPEVKALPLDPKAIERFHALADERTEDSIKAKVPVMPFHPLDTARNEDPAEYGKKFRLKAGDLVYFDVSEAGTVTEIALAAIWRGRVETKDGKAAGAWEFFEAVDADLLPFHPGRKRITIAERMFGFVEEMDPKASSEEQGLALASRIRFSDGLLGPGVSKEAAIEKDFVPLRILSSPKPPSPALYFKTNKAPSRWIGKVDLKPGEHYPQGRKMYLHHYVKPGTQPWKTRHPTDNADQKNRVRPVRPEQEFFFHIDFDNLTDAEMGLLLYALRPDEQFHHKLGMGKPLGLGSVKVEPMEWQVVDRQTRYSLAGLKAKRHAEVHHPADAGFWKLRDAAISSGLVSGEVHKAICLLGNLSGAPPSDQIHTPTLGDQADVELETFKWFVANDGGIKERDREITRQQKFLQPLAEAGGRLPVLTRPEWKGRVRRGGY